MVDLQKKGKKMKQKNIYRAITGLTLSALLLTPLGVFAASDSKNTTINANLGSTISLTTLGSVTLNVTPVAGGSQTSSSDTVSVSTNNSSGYDLTLADSDANNNLVNGGSNIAAHAGTRTTPSVLANNRWGYRVDNIGGFGTGGAAQSNVTSSSITYAGVPISGSPDNIRSTTATASGEATTVWYAVKADTTNPNGTYADTVTYTATTKI